jgi:hypothetical protein
LTTPATWDDVRAALLDQPCGTVIAYAKTSLPAPSSAGAIASVGLPVGQTADWRFPPDADCRGLHVQDFGDTWHAHIDRVHPTCDLLEHIRQDAPNFGLVAAVVLIVVLLWGSKA